MPTQTIHTVIADPADAGHAATIIHEALKGAGIKACIGYADAGHAASKAKAHPHAALMAEYAKDAAETDAPWERWQFSYDGIFWTTCKKNPEWYVNLVFRRKPRTIRIGEFDVPEPLREAPADGTRYWVADITEDDGVRLNPYTWDGEDAFDSTCLGNGAVHLTREAAQIHAKALISLTAKAVA